MKKNQAFKRILTIDVMLGLTLFLMLFVLLFLVIEVWEKPDGQPFLRIQHWE